MSKTKRYNQVYGVCKSPKTKRTRVVERVALEAILEEGFSVTPRLMSRSNPRGSSIPDTWSDVYVSGIEELSPQHKLVRNGLLHIASQLGFPLSQVVITGCLINKPQAFLYESSYIDEWDIVRPCGNVIGTIKARFSNNTLRLVYAVEMVDGRKTLFESLKT